MNNKEILSIELKTERKIREYITKLIEYSRPEKASLETPYDKGYLSALEHLITVLLCDKYKTKESEKCED